MSYNPSWTSSIGSSSDVQLNSPSAKQLLTYDDATQKWQNNSPVDVGVLAVGDPGVDRAYKVYWDKDLQVWGTVPGTLPTGYDIVEFISTNDATATTPTPPAGADAWLWKVAPGGGPA